MKTHNKKNRKLSESKLNKSAQVCVFLCVSSQPAGIKNTSSSAVETHKNILTHIQLFQPLLIMRCQVHIRTHTHSHTHRKPYASRLFSIQPAFAHCSPGVARSTSSLPDRLNMERMEDEQSRRCIHRQTSPSHVHREAQTHLCRGALTS